MSLLLLLLLFVLCFTNGWLLWSNFFFSGTHHQHQANDTTTNFNNKQEMTYEKFALQSQSKGNVYYFLPFINFNLRSSYTWSDLVLEVGFILSFFALLLHAWLPFVGEKGTASVLTKGKKMQLLVATLLYGIVMETVGCVVVKSHSHAQFVFQVTSYLPLKEWVWYTLIFYPSCILIITSVKELETPARLLQMAAVGAVLCISQDYPYEITNAREGVDAVGINENFQLGNMKIKILTGCSVVCSSFAVVSFSFCLSVLTVNHSKLRARMMNRALAIGLESVIVVVFALVFIGIFHFPITVLRYFGAAENLILGLVLSSLILTSAAAFQLVEKKPRAVWMEKSKALRLIFVPIVLTNLVFIFFVFTWRKTILLLHVEKNNNNDAGVDDSIQGNFRSTCFALFGLFSVFLFTANGVL